MKKFTVWDIVISIITLAVVSASIVPAVALMQRSPEDAKCQSNMARWAEAMQLYVEDNGGEYPTNRFLPTRTIGPQMPLSPREYDENGNPVRFVYSINWVEALYPYVIKAAKSTDRDWETFMKCPNARGYSTQTTTARMTYAFNYNLLEQPFMVIRDDAKLMLLREMDRVADSFCRPSNVSTGMSGTLPINPFLTVYDNAFRDDPPDPNIHSNGSFIVFADGHVAYFTTDYYPKSLTAAQSWDPETGQWWNYVYPNPANDTERAVNKAIAITP